MLGGLGRHVARAGLAAGWGGARGAMARQRALARGQWARAGGAVVRHRWGFGDDTPMEQVLEAVRAKDQDKATQVVMEHLSDPEIGALVGAVQGVLQPPLHANRHRSELTDVDECLEPEALTRFQSNLQALLAIERNRLQPRGKLGPVRVAASAPTSARKRARNRPRSGVAATTTGDGSDEEGGHAAGAGPAATAETPASAWAPALGSYNMVVLGSPGVGRRKAAHTLARTLAEAGVLEEAEVIQTRAQYLLHLYARQLMVPLIRSAKGGVLYVQDVTEMLETSDHSAFHAFMEEIQAPDNQPLVTVVACNATDVQRLRKSFPDMRTKFPLRLELPDLSHDDMAALIVKTADARGFRIDDKVAAQLPSIMRDQYTTADARASNAILAGSVLSTAIQRQAARASLKYPALASRPSRSSLLTTLSVDDFVRRKAGRVADPSGSADVLTELDKVVGLDSVKHHVRQLYNATRVDRKRRAAGLGLRPGQSSRSLHMVFEGNPGTGKSTVALIIARMLRDMGLLKHGQLISAKRNDLVAEYVGQTAHRTMDVVHRAMGGVLLVDEDPFGHEALNTLLDVLESGRDELVVILAGYPGEMEELLDRNPGLRSRFPTTLTFEDYGGDDLFHIGCNMLEEEEYNLHDDAVASFRAMSHEAATLCSGNARSMRNLIQRVLLQQNSRVAELPQTAMNRTNLSTIVASDIEAVVVEPSL